jgi:hypothetical protein
VYRLTREGRIPVVKLGRYYRYRPDAIDHFEMQGLVSDANGVARRASKRSDGLAPRRMTAGAVPSLNAGIRRVVTASQEIVP